MSNRPNFILFITDQHRADFLGCYGHPVLNTPNIANLATTGVAYDKFYVSSPVCMPNRASLMTCRMPSSHGVRYNGVQLSRQQVTFVELLADAGYDTSLIGKSHLQNYTGMCAIMKRTKTRPGFHRANGELLEALRFDFDDPFYTLEDMTIESNFERPTPTPFYGFQHVDLVTSQGDDVRGDYGRWMRKHAPQVLEMMGEKNQLPHDYVCPQAVRTAVPEEHYSTNYIADRAIEWINRREDTDKPFFLMVSWPDPHHPFNPPGKFWDMYRPADMEVPASFKTENWDSPLAIQAALLAREPGEANLICSAFG